MKKLATLTLVISSLLGINAHAASTEINTQREYMNAAQALTQIQRIKPANYDAIELVEGKNGTLVYYATVEEKPLEAIVIDSQSGNNLTKTYLTSKYTLGDALESVSKTHQGKAVAAHKEFEAEFGVIYLVEIENQHEEFTSTILAISADTLQVIDSEKLNVHEMLAHD